MPHENSQFLKSRDDRTKVVPVPITPQELGAQLRGKYDVVILGEVHPSQKVLDTNAAIFRELHSKLLFVESPPSSGEDLNKRNYGIPKHANWGTIDSVSVSARANGVHIEPVDLEHCRSVSSIKLFTHMARLHSGEPGAFKQAFKLFTEEVILNNIGASQIQKAEEALKKSGLEAFIEVCGDKVSDSNKENLLDAFRNLKRSEAGDVFSKIANKLDRACSGVHVKLFCWDPSERNSEMARNISLTLEKSANCRRLNGAVFSVGAGHNDPVEFKLENTGYKVANVKSRPTDLPYLDGKVFRNLNPDNRDGAEWLVACYERGNWEGSRFEDKYQLSCPDFRANSVSPAEIKSSLKQYGPRSK